MSKLLINEHPLIVLPSLVLHFGGNYTKSILVQQIHWFCDLPNSGIDHDGHRWIWKTADEWSAEVLPWLKPASIAKTLRDLESEGFIESISRIRNRWDTTKYYRINYAKLNEIVETSSTYTYVDSNAGTGQDSNAGTGQDSNAGTYTKTTTENTNQKTTHTGGGGVDDKNGSDDTDVVPLAKVNLAYENNIGLFTQMLGEKVTDAYDEYGGQWIIDAIEIAVTQNARNWAYINAILKRWSVEGRTDKASNKSEPIDMMEVSEAITWIRQ